MSTYGNIICRVGVRAMKTKTNCKSTTYLPRKKRRGVPPPLRISSDLMFEPKSRYFTQQNLKVDQVGGTWIHPRFRMLTIHLSRNSKTLRILSRSLSLDERYTLQTLLQARGKFSIKVPTQEIPHELLSPIAPLRCLYSLAPEFISQLKHSRSLLTSDDPKALSMSLLEVSTLAHAGSSISRLMLRYSILSFNALSHETFHCANMSPIPSIWYHNFALFVTQNKI